MVDAILQAAAEVFADLGYARTTTNKIAERAGVSVGSLYQYFPNKDSLLLQLLQQHMTEGNRVLDVALTRLADPNTPLEAGLRQLLQDLTALHQADPALTRALSTSVLRQSPALDEVHKDDEIYLERVVTVLSRRPDVRAGDHLAMALVLSQSAAHLCRWLVHDAPPVVPLEVLLEEIVQLLYQYLTDPPAR
jgi:AcrR family transcriptional regulator